MKLLTKIILPILCICLLWVSAEAASASAVSTAESRVQVEADGSCTVTIRYKVRLKDDGHGLMAYLPANAQNVRLDGSLKTPSAHDDRLMLDLSHLPVGVQTVEISFTLSDVLTDNTDGLDLEVPLLPGLTLPIESFSFSVTMPAQVTQRPGFFSGYYGLDIGRKMDVQMNGPTVSGTCSESLKDHETLTLRYGVQKDMFPDYHPKRPLLGGWDTAVAVLMVLSVIYYLVALMPRRSKKIRTFSPPEGLAAGDIGTCLTGCGMDLTMMVFSWAQMGYLVIQMDKRGRVYLHKRMEMGPERSDFEILCFKRLFEHRQTIDGTSLHYAKLYGKMAKKSPLLRQIYQSKTGNPKIVTGIAVLVGGLGGVLMSLQVYSAGVGTVLLALAVAVLCAGLSYLIHLGSRCIPMGNRQSMWISAMCALLWILLGLLTGSVLLTAGLVAYEWLIGIAAAVGGRRSELGRQYVGQIRGLRAHLTRGSVFDMQQCQQKNPAYFFELMPYALALGVENKFARRFGREIRCECDYLMAPGDPERTPDQWALLLRQASNCLDCRQRRLQAEQLIQKIGNKRNAS